MSKSKKRLVPVRRFKEFENADAWEQRKLGEVADVRDGTHGSPRYINDGYMLLTSKNVGNGYINYDDAKYISEKDYIQINKRSKVDVNDILMGMIGTIGNLALIRKEPNFAIKNVALIKHTINFNHQFLFQELQTSSISKELLSSMDGGTQKFISLKKIRDLSVLLPSKDEQSQISSFLDRFDSLIALHQRKLDKLKRVKSAYLTEMFPAEGEREPKRRFPGFTGAWEQRKFFDNIEKVIDFRGRTPKKLGMKWSNEGYVALSALNVKDGYIDFTADVHYANKALYDKWMVGNDLYKGQVLFTTEAPMGNVAQIPDNQKYVLSQRTIAFDVFRNKITNDFLAVLLRSQNVQHKLKSLASGGTAQGISQKSLSQLKVTVPTRINEQQKIGEFFKQLDSLIALHQRKLDKLKKMKAAYLNEMFI